MASLTQRIMRLEETYAGDDDGCEWCTGTMVVVCDHLGNFVSASFNRRNLTEAECRQHKADNDAGRCSRCGHEFSPIQITVGGRWS